MAVLVPRPMRGGKVDSFVDDLINVFVDTLENCARQPHVVPLAMHVTSQPHAEEAEEPVRRRPILLQPKRVAAGRPEEVQTVLGRTLDTRQLEISLPKDKYNAWLGGIKRIGRSGRCTQAKLETLVGRLNHMAYILPNARHFLSHISAGATREQTAEGQTATMRLWTTWPALWEDFLGNAHSGVLMNLLVTRMPTKVWSDACPYGIGGYSLSGQAWRIRIPSSSPIFGHQGVNNLLEFIGMVINIWLSRLEDGSGDESCILAIR